MKRAFLPLLLLIGLVVAMSASAATRDGAVWDVDCVGFTSNGGGFLLDRDNTGTGREQIIITAVDGEGNVIFGPVSEDFFVNSSVYINDGVTFEWTTNPVANPLMVAVVSPAGNGLVEQIVYQTEGTCRGLPEGDIDFDDAISGAVVANPDLIDPQPGYLLVNTFRLNLRSGDGAEYTIVGQVPGGTELAVLGVNADRDWWYVQTDTLRGWVTGNTEFVIPRGDLRGTPIVEPQGEIVPPRFFLYTRQPIYSRDSTASRVVCEIAGNQEYVIVGRNPGRTWFGIEATCEGDVVVGWIPADTGAVRNPGDLPIEVLD